MRVRAVTFDFYDTLVYHRAGSGRGARYGEYLERAGLVAAPWEHQVLYDVFEYYAEAYEPGLDEDQRQALWVEFTARLFERTRVRGAGGVDPAAHAVAIREIMGPECLAVFDEVSDVLHRLARAGLALGVISDWQKGLRHFCDELGLGAHMDTIVASAEEGFQKPDPRLFDCACRRLGVSAGEILHVGDRLDDVVGAHRAGFSAALLVRRGVPPTSDAPVVRDLRELFALI